MATITPSKPVADVKKHTFDNSQQHVFSAKVGQLLPILNLETIPNGDYEIDVADLLRTMPLNEAAYIRCKQNIDFFFVPYSQLYTRFNQFFAKRHDPVIAGSELPEFLPNFDLLQLVLSIGSTPFDDSSFADMFDFSLRCQVGKMLDLLGYGTFPLEVPFTRTDETINKTVFSYEWISFFQSIFPTVQVYYETLFQRDTPTGPYYLKDDWFDLLQSYISTNNIVYYVNPFRAAAFCKIWNDFYRNPYRDQPLSPVYFNYDDIKGTTEENSHITGSVREWTQFCDTFNMRYRRWKNDIFTASFPDAQFGDASIVSIDPNAAIDYIALNEPKISFDGISSSSFSAGGQVSDAGTGRVFISDTVGSPGRVVSLFSNNISFGDMASLGFTVAQLRQAIAMQHWAENVIRAGNRTEDNFRAHFGVSPRYESDMHVKFLGSFDGRLDLNIVSATSQSETVSNLDKRVGSLASNGISSLKGNRINFHANDFGIIVGVFSLLPEAEYNSSMVDRANIKIEPFDFPFPEFQNIGFQPIIAGDLRFHVRKNNDIVGYVFPYMEYKTALDKVHGDFQKRAVFDSGSFNPESYRFVQGSKSYYVAPRWQMQYDLLNDSKVLYVNPRVYDTVFGVAANDMQNTDQFNITCYFDIKSRLPLSVLGLPQY